MSRVRILTSGLLGILLLVACGGGAGDAAPPQAATAAVQQPEATGKVVEVKISHYKFNPEKIALKLGEPVQFKAISTDSIHTFTVEELGIEVDLSKIPRETKLSEVFIPQQTGTFQIICRVHPLSRYSSMQGILEVTQ